MKGSEDSEDYSLVSNKNLSKILPSRDWAVGQVTWAKMAKNLPHLWCHLDKKQNPKFFSLQTWRLAECFEGLNSSLEQSAEELCGWQDNWNMLDFSPISKYDILIRWQWTC